jgi:hypothetical protein
MANRQKTLKVSMIPNQILMKFLKYWQIKTEVNWGEDYLQDKLSFLGE